MKKSHIDLLATFKHFAIRSKYLFRFMVCFLCCLVPLTVNAVTSTWTSSDDPTWYYKATLSNPTLKKVASTQEGLAFVEGAVPVSVSHCTMGESGLFDKNLFVWCFFSAGHSKIAYRDTKPYVHWFQLDSPSPADPYWMGSRLLVWGNALHFGPGFQPMSLPNTHLQEGDLISSVRVSNSAASWSGAAFNNTGNIIYLSRQEIEADMFGNKFRTQKTLTQRIQMTDPVNFSDACCDNGVYEQSFDYEITLHRYPLLITLPTHVDMGEVAVGAPSEVQTIPVTVSANDQPLEVVQGVASISFEEIEPLTDAAGTNSCEAMVQISNEQGPVQAGKAVDLHSFRNGILAQVENTDGCSTGAYNSILSFTVAWK